jgi:putative ABC transport system permease protein
MNITESISLAFAAVKGNKLRASLTLLSIAIGVFAIIGSGTLVNSMDSAFTSELASLGETSFEITRMPSIQTGNTWRKYRKRKSITYSEFKDFKRRMTISNDISATSASSGHVIKSEYYTTDADVVLIGADENYFTNYNMKVDFGRAFTAEDISLGRNIAIIGNDVVVKIFPNMNPIGKQIRIKNQAFTVVGVLETKGAVMGESMDNYTIIPLTQFLKYYASWWEESLSISVKATSKDMLPKTIDEATSVMRTIRDVKPWEENSFEIETNESISDQFKSFSIYLSVFGIASGIIALIAAGVGIMNIMLVSVKERTREIGIRKAVGARRSWIMYQFIIEAITLSQIGGLIGIALGLGIGGFFSQMMGFKAVYSLDWVLAGVGICTLLGIVFGAFPANKASKLDPIDALRYE